MTTTTTTSPLLYTRDTLEGSIEALCALRAACDQLSDFRWSSRLEADVAVDGALMDAVDALNDIFQSAVGAVAAKRGMDYYDVMKEIHNRNN